MVPPATCSLRCGEAVAYSGLDIQELEVVRHTDGKGVTSLAASFNKGWGKSTVNEVPTFAI